MKKAFVYVCIFGGILYFASFFNGNHPSSVPAIEQAAPTIVALPAVEAEKEFKASRRKIITQMKDFSMSAQYASAVDLGHRYSAVKDKEFQKLYAEAARLKQKQEDAAQKKLAKQQDERVTKKAFQEALDDNSLSIISKTLCEMEVKGKLRSPSTADFPWTPGQITAYPTGKRAVYSSYVDSQNGFGAVIRTNFACALHYKGGEVDDINNWDVKDVQVF